MLPSSPSAEALAIVFAGQLLEYVAPPVPGEATTLLGVFLALTGGWPIVGVLAAATAGAVVGGGIVWAVGRRLSWLRRRPRVDALVEGFHRHGPAYIAVNRFLPGVRAFFFVAAGMAGMRPGPLLLYALGSALAWNTLLVAAGWAAASSWDRMCGWFVTYTQVALVAVVALGLLVILRVARS